MVYSNYKHLAAIIHLLWIKNNFKSFVGAVMAVIVWQLELHKVCPRHVTTAGHIILTQSVTYTAKAHYLHTVCVSYTSYITKTHCFHTIPLWKKNIENYYKYHFN